MPGGIGGTGRGVPEGSYAGFSRGLQTRDTKGRQRFPPYNLASAGAPNCPARFQLATHIREPSRTGGADLAPLVMRTPDSTRVRLRDVRGYLPTVRVIAIRDLRARYKQAVLGPAWVIFQPFALLVAFILAFRNVTHVSTSGVPYALFAIVGLAVWSYFSATIAVATSSIVGNLQLVRLTPCPRFALPLATLVSNLPSLIVPAVAALIAALASGYLALNVLILPVLILWLVALVGAFAVFLATLAVRARDIASVAPFVLQITMFLSPVAYDTSHLSATLRTIIAINPLTGVLDAWRWAMLGMVPPVLPVALSLGTTVVGAALAWRTFTAIERTMCDEI